MRRIATLSTLTSVADLRNDDSSTTVVAADSDVLFVSVLSRVVEANGINPLCHVSEEARVRHSSNGLRCVQVLQALQT